MSHVAPAHQTGRVGQAARVLVGSRLQEQSRRVYRAAGNNDQRRLDPNEGALSIDFDRLDA